MAKTREFAVDATHRTSEADSYIYPSDPEVRAHLDWYMGLKLGFMMHWAPVTQLGTMESWPLSDGDWQWSQAEIHWTDDMEEFKRRYWELNRSFNPVAFRPDQ